jgi:enoyl-CoA hydratase
MSAHVSLAFDGALARITLRRPDKLNALNRSMIAALAGAAEAIEANRDTRFAIIGGEGKAFYTGGDIAAFREKRAPRFTGE